MNNPGWSRSYFVVLLLAIGLVPASAYVAAVTTQGTAHALAAMNGTMASSTEFFAQLGVRGMAVIAGASLLAIVCMAIKQNRAVGTVVSALLFAATLAFFLVAALASNIPFWSIMWRLAP
jgi:hypothetical protein